MMHYGETQPEFFKMMSLHKYNEAYSIRSLNYFLKDKEVIDTEHFSSNAGLLRKSTLFMQNWKDNSEYHFYVPVQKHDKSLYRQNVESLKFYVDFVKPTTQIETMKISVVSNQIQGIRQLMQCPFVPRYRLA